MNHNHRTARILFSLALIRSATHLGFHRSTSWLHLLQCETRSNEVCCNRRLPLGERAMVFGQDFAASMVVVAQPTK